MAKRSKAPEARAVDPLSFSASLKLKKKPGAVFLCGDEVTLREWLLDELRRHYHEKLDAACQTVSLADKGAGEVLDLMGQRGMFSAASLIVIRDAEDLLEGTIGESELAKAVSDMGDDDGLVLVSGRSDRKREALSRLFTRVVGQWMSVVVCSPLVRGSFSKFCHAQASDLNISLVPQDIEALEAFSGGRAGLAAQELKRAASSGSSAEGSGSLVDMAAEFRWVDDLLVGKVRAPDHVARMGPDGVLRALGLLRSRLHLALDQSQNRTIRVPMYPETRRAIEAAAQRLGRAGLEKILFSLGHLDRSLRQGKLQGVEVLRSAALLWLGDENSKFRMGSDGS